MKTIRSYALLPGMVLLWVAGGISTVHGAATITVVNNDGAGEGFNDPAVFVPVGGNNAVTLGQARLNAFQYAANLWGTCINSNVVIRVGATMDPLACTPTTATLGSAGANTVHRDFAGAPVANTWYPQALANALAGVDLDPATADIGASFNSSINGNPACLASAAWYYGFDGNPGANQRDFVTVVLHEIGHGLGFATQVNLGTGAKFMGRDDAYMRFLEQAGAVPSTYPAMTDAQRITASTSDPSLRWTGANATAAHPAVPISAGLNGGFLRNHAPGTQVPGSSVSHWSTALTPNELMEPTYTGPDHNMSLAVYLLRDIGWTLDATALTITCPANIVVECTAAGGAPASNPTIATFLAGATTTGGCGEVRVRTDAPGFFSIGTRSVIFTARDGANVQATCSRDVTVVDTTAPVMVCPSDITVECSAFCGTPANDPQLGAFFAGVSATDTCDPSPTITDDAPFCFPLGQTLVTFTAEDDEGNISTCTATVTVEDTTPPTIAVNLDRTVLWPPNHKLVTINAGVPVADICDPDPICELVSIVSSEPDNGDGDGNTVNDIQDATTGTCDLQFRLRSERSGMGSGRLYSITYRATDHSGNFAEATGIVRVPHDQQGIAIAADGWEGSGSGFAPGATHFALVIRSLPRVVPDEGGEIVESGIAGEDIIRRPPGDAETDAPFSAQDVVEDQAFVGNGAGVLAPTRTHRLDVDGDGLEDLVCFYPVAGTEALSLTAAPDDGPVGLHYTTRTGTDYLLENIYELGPPIQLPELVEMVDPGSGAGRDRGGMGDAGSEVPDEPGEAAERGRRHGNSAPATPSGPLVTDLLGVFPNPLRSQTTLAFSLAREAAVDLSVYDVHGARVRTLRRETLGAGRYQVSWDGRDEGGRRLTGALYFVRFVAGRHVVGSKIVIVQ